MTLKMYLNKNLLFKIYYESIIKILSYNSVFILLCFFFKGGVGFHRTFQIPMTHDANLFSTFKISFSNFFIFLKKKAMNN